MVCYGLKIVKLVLRSLIRMRQWNDFFFSLEIRRWNDFEDQLPESAKAMGECEISIRNT